MQKEKMVEWLAEGNVSLPKLLITRYVELGLVEEEFMLLLHVYTFKTVGNLFPTPDELAKRMTCSSSDCMDLLRRLLQRGFLSIEEKKDESGIINESYSLTPLWEKLTYLMFKDDKQQSENEKLEVETNLYSLFENEFGRPLSPMEAESLTMWIDEDQHNPVLIKTALREAVMCGKLNFRYIDRILFEWKKNGIKTIEQAKNHGKKFRPSTGQPKKTEQQSERNLSIPFYNWLES